jgi:DNA-binding NarL/FixJ family response regulator
MSVIARKSPAGFRPLDPGLNAEVLAWVNELRTIWGAAGLSMYEFASLHPVDKGTISRYLNGQRVPRDRWFLDKLLAIQADNGQPVTPAAREHMTSLHLRALAVAHPHEYRVRLVSDELEIALTGKFETERYARALEEQLAERSRLVQELKDDKGRLRTAWDAERATAQAVCERLTREITEITSQLHLARQRASQAEQRCQQLEDLLSQLDAREAFTAVLNQREIEVLRQMAEGRSNLGIAKELSLSPRAVETHVTSVFGKFRFIQSDTENNRVRAVLAFLAQRNVEPLGEDDSSTGERSRDALSDGHRVAKHRTTARADKPNPSLLPAPISRLFRTL